MARDFWFEIEHYGTKENISSIEETLEHRLGFEKTSDGFFIQEGITISCFIEEEYKYVSEVTDIENYDLLEGEIPTLILSFRLSKFTNRGVLKREQVWRVISKDLNRKYNYRLLDDDEAIFLEKERKLHLNEYRVLTHYKVDLEKQPIFSGEEKILFLYWAFSRNLLNSNVHILINRLVSDLSEDINQKVLNRLKENLYDENICMFFNDKSKNFCNFYTLMISSEYSLNLYSDIGTLFPSMVRFNTILSESNNYKAIFDKFDIAYERYVEEPIIL